MNQDRKNNLQNSNTVTPTKQDQKKHDTDNSMGLASQKPKQDRPQRKPTGSFSDSFKSGIKDKSDKMMPDFNATRNLKSKMDNIRKTEKNGNDALNNIRAKQAPQLPRGNSPSNRSSLTRENGDFGEGRPSFLPKGPKFLDDDNFDIADDDDDNVGTLRSILGGKKKKKKTPVQFMVEGMINLKVIAMAGIFIFVGIIFLGIFVAFLVVNDKNTPIAIADGNEEYRPSKEQKEFKERLDEVHEEYAEDGKSFDVKNVGAVFIILSTYGKGYDYDSMTTSEIREIADLMLDSDGSYSEDTFKSNLKGYFQSKIPGKSDAVYERYVDEVFEALKEYNEEKNKNLFPTGQTGSMCTYTFKGMNLEQYGSGSNNKEMTISNLMVRLMSVNGGMCDGVNGQVLDDGELIPFEKYVLGVALEEIGPDAPPEAFKTQMIVARSYALTQASASGNALSRRLFQENGQWILQINNCVTDQVYCDPDKGCSRNTSCSNQYGVMHVGYNTAANGCRKPIAEDSPLRQYANEVAGKIPLDSQGRIYLTNFQQAEQNLMAQYARNGLDYTQILMKIFPQVKSISESNCTDGEESGTTGSYKTWKQTNSKWANIKMAGNTTIKEAGCLATSIAMLIQKSKAKTTIDGEFNPGTFVEAMKKVNGFDARANLNWNSVEKIASNFKYQESMKTDLSTMATKKDKIQAIKQQATAKDTYCVVAVNNDGHWVAVDKVENDSIKILDPGSKATDLFKEYDWSTTTRLECFKVG